MQATGCSASFTTCWQKLLVALLAHEYILEKLHLRIASAAALAQFHNLGRLRKYQ